MTTHLSQSEQAVEAIQTTKRFDHADGLRGVAALWVLLFHAYEGRHIESLAHALPDWLVNGIFKAGHLGVSVFFVLSGFVMACVVQGRSFSGTQIPTFLWRRLARLSPPFYASIVVVVGLSWVKYRALGGSFEWPAVDTLLAHLAYLQGVLQLPELNAVYWTLGIELQFYIMFALCMRAVSWRGCGGPVDRCRARVALVLCFFSMLWPLGLTNSQPWPASFLPHWWAFWLGACVGWRGEMGRALPVLLLAVLGLGIWRGQPELIVAAITGWALLQSSYLTLTYRCLSSRPLLLAGMVSYSLYLLHNPLSGAGFNLLYRVVPRNAFGEMAALVLVTAFCIFVSYLAYRWIEMPSIQWSRGTRR